MQLFRRGWFTPTLYATPVLLLCLATRAAPPHFFSMKAAQDGPAHFVSPPPLQKGDADAGRNVFRFETFGNEGFWRCP